MIFLKKGIIALFSACLLLIGITSGYWTRRPNSYSNCELLESAVPHHPNKPISKRQLVHDAEFVEDLCIRHADERFGPHSGHFDSWEDYGRGRNECITRLFQAVARNDDVTDNQVRTSLGQRPIESDVAIILSFVIVYTWAANALAFRIWRAPRLDYGTRHAKIMSGYAAILLGLAFVLGGEGWCGTMETIRLGNGHESYRGERVPWTHHHYLEYIAGAAIFCGACILHRRVAGIETSQGLR